MSAENTWAMLDAIKELVTVGKWIALLAALALGYGAAWKLVEVEERLEAAEAKLEHIERDHHAPPAWHPSQRNRSLVR